MASDGHLVITLYDFELDENCYKVRLFLAFLRLAHTKIPVNMVPGGEHTRPPLLLLNPLGTLPILHDDSTPDDALVLSEAEAILAYLAQHYDGRRTWLPTDPRLFGRVMMWLAFAARDLSRVALARHQALFGMMPDAPDADTRARDCFRIMDDHMTARRFAGAAWFVGSGPTLADIALFPAIALSRDIGIDHEAYPALRHWMRQVRTLPGFITMPGVPDYQ